MPDITLIAHNIRSAHNVGSMFRTADGLGIKHIVLSGYTPHPNVPGDTRLPHVVTKIESQIHKTALGAEKIVPFTYVEDIEEWLQHLKLPLIALEQSPRSIDLSDFEPPDAFALLLGEEVAGVDSNLLLRCDAIIEIPMVGKKESFNVSIAAAIALYVLSGV